MKTKEVEKVVRPPAFLSLPHDKKKHIIILTNKNNENEKSAELKSKTFQKLEK